MDAPRDATPTPDQPDGWACAPVAGLETLSIVGGRPVGVTPEGFWLLDVAGAKPQPGAKDWPVKPTPGGAAPPPAPSYELRGDSLDDAVLLVVEPGPRQEGAARKNAVVRRRRGAWASALVPGGASYVDVAAAGPHVVALASSRTHRASLVSLEADPDARAPRRSFVPSEPPADPCAPKGPVDVEVSASGLVAAARVGCEGRRAWIEIFEPPGLTGAGSRGYVPVTEPPGSWVELAWLGGGALLGAVEIPGEPRPRRALHRIDVLTPTPVGGLLLDATSSLSPGENGTVLVTAEAGYFVVDAAGAPSEVRRWPKELGVRTLGSRQVSRVALGRDGALYTEVHDDTRSVIRCVRP